MMKDESEGAGAPAAALDIGTNTILLVVGRRRSDGALEVLEDTSRTARLGEGLAKTGKLGAPAVERALGILREYRERMDALKVPLERRMAVGTAVLRRASNPELLLVPARDVLGFAIQVIPEQEEARLGFEAVLSDTGAAARRDAIVIDVGGGSTEVVTDGGEALFSAPIGAVVLTEQHLAEKGAGAIPDEEWNELRQAALEACRVYPAEACAPRDGAPEGPEVVCLGGTACNLASLEVGGERFDPRRVEGTVLAATHVAHWAEVLRRRSAEERASFPIEADRAAILPAGLACLAAACERIGAERIRVSARGLRYGVLSTLL